MRREPFTVGSYVHIVKRGARGLPIVQDFGDSWRVLLMLNHFNDHFHAVDWFRDLMDEGLEKTLTRASTWPEKIPRVSIEAFTLLTNHFHLILKETEEGGVSKFMHKFCTGMANHANAKYNQRGSLFQGAYRLRTINDDNYFRYVAAYVMVKNTFELFPLGYEKACSSFNEAWEWAVHYPFSSLGHYAGVEDSPILHNPFLKELFPEAREFKSFAQDVLLGRVSTPLEQLEEELEIL
ncbi:MAG: transposase [bacterium]|nr:transposase [bacterium]